MAANASGQTCWVDTVASGSCGSAPSAAGAVLTYDARGNRISEGSSSLRAGYVNGFDQANRLTSFTPAGGSVTTYAYNADGLRLSKSSGGVTTKFVWSNNGGTPQLLQAVTTSSVTSFAYGPDGVVAERYLQSGSTASIRNFVHDLNGNVRIVAGTGTSPGTPGGYSYDAWGKVTAQSGATSVLQFNGQYVDAESGFVYLRARSYDPVTGQFISHDPLFMATLDGYGYAGNDPYNNADPLGLFCWLGKNPNGSCRGSAVLKQTADWVVAHRHEIIDFAIGLAATQVCFASAGIGCALLLVDGVMLHVASDLQFDDEHNIGLDDAIIRTGVSAAAGGFCKATFGAGCNSAAAFGTRPGASLGSMALPFVSKSAVNVAEKGLGPVAPFVVGRAAAILRWMTSWDN